MTPRNGKGAHTVDVRAKPKDQPDALARPAVDLGAWLEAARREMESMFSQFWGGRGSILSGWRMPRADLADLGDRYEVTVELPGIPKERVRVQVTPGALEIRAEAGSEREETRKDFHYREIGRQAFYRSIPLPQDADDAHAAAQWSDGCLRIDVPKRTDEGKGRRVHIS